MIFYTSLSKVFNTLDKKYFFYNSNTRILEGTQRFLREIVRGFINARIEKTVAGRLRGRRGGGVVCCTGGNNSKGANKLVNRRGGGGGGQKWPSFFVYLLCMSIPMIISGM